MSGRAEHADIAGRGMVRDRLRNGEASCARHSRSEPENAMRVEPAETAAIDDWTGRRCPGGADAAGRGARETARLLVFPGRRTAATTSDSVMTQASRGFGNTASGCRFRSSFKDWARRHDVDALGIPAGACGGLGNGGRLREGRPLAEAPADRAGWADCMSGR